MSDSGLRDRRCANADEHDPHEYRFSPWNTTGALYYCHGGVVDQPAPAWPQDPIPKLATQTYYVTVMHSSSTGRLIDGYLGSAFVDLPGDPADPLVFDWMVKLLETMLAVEHVLPLWWVRQPAS